MAIGAASFADWYEPPEDGYEQGDIFFDVPVLRPSFDIAVGSTTVELKKITAILLTQTCDLPKKAQETILIAEVRSYEELARPANSQYRAKETRRALAHGTGIADFLLPPAPPGLAALSWSVVNYRLLHVVANPEHLDHERRINASLRLASPYKEHLAQAYSRFMMRVALPTTLREFETQPLPQ